MPLSFPRNSAVGVIAAAVFFIIGWYSCHTYEKSIRLEREARAMVEYQKQVRSIQDKYDALLDQIQIDDNLAPDVIRDAIIRLPEPSSR